MEETMISLRHSLLLLPMVIGLSTLGTTAATGQPVQLFAKLLGANEVGGGDSNGSGGAVATLDDDRNRICVGLVVANIHHPTAAHIHEGQAGVNGPIVIPLETPESGDPGTSSVCRNISQNLMSSLQNNPSGFYVNVHTENFPAGAVRGQLFAF
jgi:hypothetical protein